MKVTRTLQANVPDGLSVICKVMGIVRADIWRRYGAWGNMGKNADAIRKSITAADVYSALPVDGTVRAETTKDIVNDILTFKAAALVNVRQAVADRTKDNAARKRLYALLKSDQWLTDNFLHRQVRSHFWQGVSHIANQFIVRSDIHSSCVVDGKLVVTIRMAPNYGSDIRLVTTSSRKNVDLKGSNLRIIVKDGLTEIHYAKDKGDGRVCGNQVVGVDKRYTEAFTDSDGVAHGPSFGAVLTQHIDKAAATGKQRNKLHALEKKHRAAGRTLKADRIKAHNLGRKKIGACKERAQKKLRTIAFQAVHTLVDKAAVVASEGLTSPIAKKQQSTRFNRRMSSWAKGTLAEALDSVCTQRKARHVLVNAAYTSQMDSTNCLLQGQRVGDKFYRESGDVLQADHNAALNVLARLDDPDISRFTPYWEVRRILLARSPAQLSVNRLELGAQARQPSADKSVSSFD
jgi:hypothetical protein